MPEFSKKANNKKNGITKGIISVKPALKPPQTPFKIIAKIGCEADKAGSIGLMKLKPLEIKLERPFPIKNVQSSKPAMTPIDVK